MGAAASMQHVYTDAMDWFKKYFDKVAYLEDFRDLDVNKDGVIRFANLRTWLAKKAMDGSFWGVISTNDTIIRIAYMIASKAEDSNPETLVAAVINIKTFKDFLIHLFVLSILWVHFKHADEWNEGTDLGSEKLSFVRFKMACRTFSSSQAHESLTDEKIQADFDLLDTNKSGTIEFFEVCRYCANFFDEEYAKKFEIRKTAAMARKTHIDSPSKIEDKSLRFIRTVRVSSAANATVFSEGNDDETNDTFLLNASGKARKAMDIIGEKIAENAKVATFEEMRISTEIALGLDPL